MVIWGSSGEALGKLWGGFGKLGEALGRLLGFFGKPLGGFGGGLWAAFVAAAQRRESRRGIAGNAPVAT